jgi:hypothetical protein
MNVEEAWQSMQDLSANRAAQLPEEQAIHQKEAHNVLSLLKTRLMWNLIFSFVIALLYVVLMIVIPEALVRAGLGIVLGFTLWAARTAWMEYIRIQPVLTPSNSVADTLQFHSDHLRAWMKLQEQVAKWVYPVAAATGFVWGASMGADKPIAAVMSHWPMQVALLISTILLSIGGHYLGKWLTKKAFGEVVQQIESTLDSLQADR